MIVQSPSRHARGGGQFIHAHPAETPLQEELFRSVDDRIPRRTLGRGGPSVGAIGSDHPVHSFLLFLAARVVR
jgi:hypothetical protein